MDLQLRQITLGRSLRLKGMLDITSIFTFLLVVFWFPAQSNPSSGLIIIACHVGFWLLVTSVSVFVDRAAIEILVKWTDGPYVGW